MKKLLISSLCVMQGLLGHAYQPAENLNRGLVAVKTDSGVFLSWRARKADTPATAFNLYRDGRKLNSKPITSATNFTDPAGLTGAKYRVEVLNGKKVVETDTCSAWSQPYLRLHMDRPADIDNDEMRCSYRPNDVMTGDLDGDGVLELIVKWYPTNARDSSHQGLTGPPILDAYRLDGTRLWRIDLGQNMRSGAHYNQIMVYDFDGDSRAEVICKTAPGTIDGRGHAVLLGNDKPTDDYRCKDATSKSFGHIISGPEYLTVFSGLTGEEVHTIPYHPTFAEGLDVWGDTHGNRSDRYLAAVAYLDGEHPSVLMCRGYYEGSFVWAVDFDGKQLKERWMHASTTKGEGLWGEGAHSVTVGDVDGDGCDELVYGAAVLDHDGKLLYRTGGGHGDALHLAKMRPELPGLQIFMPHEGHSPKYQRASEMRDAATGKILAFSPNCGEDVGRGLTANITSLYPGYEYWTSENRYVYNNGERLARLRLPINFRIYWDGDLLDELLNGTSITKPTPDLRELMTLVNFNNYTPAAACNGTKNTPNLQADLLGDWREEVILHDPVNASDLLIFTTTIPTSYKIPCLLDDRQYRLAIAWQNVAYNQPPHLSFSPEEVYGKK